MITESESIAPIATRGSAAATGLTMERYIETMMPQYGSNSVKRWTRRGHYALEREDLMSEAALVLSEIWNKYAHLKPEGELRRMGTRGFFNHIGNVFHRCRAYGAGDAKIVYADALTTDDGFGYQRHPADAAALRRGGSREPQLDSLIMREELETAAAPDFRGASADAVRKIFSDVCRAVREDDGYSLVEAAEKLNYNQRGEVRMIGAVTGGGPMSPEVEMAEAQEVRAGVLTVGGKSRAVEVTTVEDGVHVTRGKKVAKAPKAEKSDKKPKATREESDARVGTFKKGQRVKYKGGGRTALKAGTQMVVLGSVKSKGRLYVRLQAGDQAVTLSSALVSKI